jgi:hypothetical protein
VRDIIAVINTEFAVSEEEAKNDTRVFLYQLAELKIITFPEE